jgi:hypothetical protein
MEVTGLGSTTLGRTDWCRSHWIDWISLEENRLLWEPGDSSESSFHRHCCHSCTRSHHCDITCHEALTRANQMLIPCSWTSSSVSKPLFFIKFPASGTLLWQHKMDKDMKGRFKLQTENGTKCFIHSCFVPTWFMTQDIAKIHGSICRVAGSDSGENSERRD